MRITTRFAALATAVVAAATVSALPASASAGPDRGRDARCAHELTAAITGFDRAFFAKDLDAFIDFYADDATIIYFNGTRIYSKAEARANSAALFAQDWTASFDVLKTTVQGCRSGQVIEDGHFTRAGTTSHFLVGLSWVREQGRWKVAIDQGSQLPA